MTFGDPIIYFCPSCNKPMKMTTYLSYTVHSSGNCTDGNSAGCPRFTPDLAKCPHCKKLFSRHSVKNKKTMNITAASKIKEIEDPDRSEFIRAVKETPNTQVFAEDNEEKEFVVFDAWAEVADWQFAQDTIYSGFILPENIASIGKCAFAHCKKLKKIDIGKNVLTIGKYAFRKDNRPGAMSNITEVINRCVKPQIIDKYHFYNNDLSKAVLNVPEQSIGAYQQAEGWKEFGSIVALDENKYPAQSGEFFGKKKNADNKKSGGENKNEGCIPLTLHIWLGNFKSKNELEEYADNSEYEWEYYGHFLDEDNFDEPPEEYGLNCGFCFDNGFQYEEAADIADTLFWEFHKKKQTIMDLIAGFPVDHAEVLEACREKYPELQYANSSIVLFGYPNKQDDFEKTKPDKPCFYLGEFEIPDDDTDGQYEAWV